MWMQVFTVKFAPPFPSYLNPIVGSFWYLTNYGEVDIHN